MPISVGSALLRLRSYGFRIPEIPYEEIQASNKREAVEEIAAYNSEFAEKNPDTLLFTKYNINGEDLAKFNLGYEVKQTDFSIGREKLFSSDSDIADIQEDTVDIAPQDNEGKLFARPGDIFQLGHNRLMCGDCRAKKDVVALMNGRMADMILTDPPYNVNYEAWRRSVNSPFRMTQWKMICSFCFLQSVFNVMFSIVKPGGSFYVFHADSGRREFPSRHTRSRFQNRTVLYLGKGYIRHGASGLPVEA